MADRYRHRMPDDLDNVRPLLAGTVRWMPDAAIVELGETEVRVQGDAAVLRAILGGCDGRSTLAELIERHGPDAGELTTLLLDRGAIVDAEHAWRVLHRQSSVGSALGRAIDDAELAALQRATFVPARPLANVAVVPLAPAPSAVGALAARRRSATPAEPSVPATFVGLSAVLAAAYSVHASDAGTNTGTVDGNARTAHGNARTARAGLPR
jgi:hypothetical protein